jgi:hypothetical protein
MVWPAWTESLYTMRKEDSYTDLGSDTGRNVLMSRRPHGLAHATGMQPCRAWVLELEREQANKGRKPSFGPRICPALRPQLGS